MKLVHFKDWKCTAEFGQYANGRTAISLVDAYDYSPVAKATVNLIDYPEHHIEAGQVHIKNYFENEGMVEALEKAGVVKELESFGIGPFQALCSLCKLLEDEDETT